MRYFALAAVLLLTMPALAANAPPQLSPYAAKQIVTLMPKLAKAGSPEAAKPIESQVLTLFNQSGSPSVDLLMVRAAAAARVTQKLRPRFWNRSPTSRPVSRRPGACAA